VKASTPEGLAYPAACVAYFKMWSRSRFHDQIRPKKKKKTPWVRMPVLYIEKCLKKTKCPTYPIFI